MADGILILGLRDSWGRRGGIDRRTFSIPEYMPERRSGQERRSQEDRRRTEDGMDVIHLKRYSDRYREFVSAQKGVFFGLMLSLPVWALIIFRLS